MNRCSCCGGEKVALLAPYWTPSRYTPLASTEPIIPTLVCGHCDSVHLWPAAHRFRGAWQ